MSQNLINISKSSTLRSLLNNIIEALEVFSAHDFSIRKLRGSLLQHTTSESTPAESLLSDLENIGAVIKSYNIKFKELDASNPLGTLPGLLYEAVKETDHLSTISELKSKPVQVQALLSRIDQFVRAGKK